MLISVQKLLENNNFTKKNQNLFKISFCRSNSYHLHILCHNTRRSITCTYAHHI